MPFIFALFAQSGCSLGRRGLWPVERRRSIALRPVSRISQRPKLLCGSRISSWFDFQSAVWVFSRFPSIQPSGYWKTTLGFQPHPRTPDSLMHYRSGQKRKWQVSRGSAIWRGSEHEAAAFHSPSNILPL